MEAVSRGARRTAKPAAAQQRRRRAAMAQVRGSTRLLHAGGCPPGFAGSAASLAVPRLVPSAVDASVTHCVGFAAHAERGTLVDRIERLADELQTMGANRVPLSKAFREKLSDALRAFTSRRDDWLSTRVFEALYRFFQTLAASTFFTRQRLSLLAGSLEYAAYKLIDAQRPDLALQLLSHGSNVLEQSHTISAARKLSWAVAACRAHALLGHVEAVARIVDAHPGQLPCSVDKAAVLSEIVRLDFQLGALPPPGGPRRVGSLPAEDERRLVQEEAARRLNLSPALFHRGPKMLKHVFALMAHGAPGDDVQQRGASRQSLEVAMRDLLDGIRPISHVPPRLANQAVLMLSQLLRSGSSGWTRSVEWEVVWKICTSANVSRLKVDLAVVSRRLAADPAAAGAERQKLGFGGWLRWQADARGVYVMTASSLLASAALSRWGGGVVVTHTAVAELRRMAGSCHQCVQAHAAAALRAVGALPASGTVFVLKASDELQLLARLPSAPPHLDANARVAACIARYCNSELDLPTPVVLVSSSVAARVAADRLGLRFMFPVAGDPEFPEGGDADVAEGAMTLHSDNLDEHVSFVTDAAPILRDPDISARLHQLPTVEREAVAVTTRRDASREFAQGIINTKLVPPMLSWSKKTRRRYELLWPASARGG
ncbi:hypothetical protein DIPPA_08328 [Diplonema papillatum]|nr:hypothetical protein DIPPA_08328 [Diplonema papillatum]